MGSITSPSAEFVPPVAKFWPYQLKGIINPDGWFKEARGTKSNLLVRRENRFAIREDLVGTSSPHSFANNLVRPVVVEIIGPAHSDGRNLYLRVQGEDKQLRRYAFRIVTPLKTYDVCSFVGETSEGPKLFDVRYDEGFGYTSVKVKEAPEGF